MAISTKKKNIIIAMWKTGNFKSYTSIAKHYKISTKTAQKIIGSNTHDNEELVELGVKYEMAKNSTKNTHEIKAVENIVKDRIKVHDITNDILNGIQSYIKDGKAHKVVTESIGEAGSSGVAIEYPLQAEHFEKAMNTVDRASITLGVNQRHAPKQDINLAQQQNNTNYISQEEVSVAVANSLPD